MKTLIVDFARQQDTDNPFLRPNDQTVRYSWTLGDGAPHSFEIEWKQPFFDELRAVSASNVDPAAVQGLGNHLRAFLGGSWEEKEAAIEAALRAGESVRITFRSAAEELYVLPWDLLTLKNGEHLFARPGVLLRYGAPATRTIPERPRPRPEGGRILFAWSDKGGSVPFDVHRDAIERTCRQGNLPFDAERDVLSAVSLASLDKALRDGPPVTALHILCHGEKREKSDLTFGLAWHASDSQDKHVVDARQLEELLTPHAGQLRLVVLCACDSSNIGKLGNPLGSPALALHRAGIQSVLASRFVLSARASETFVSTFYGALIKTLTSLEEAFLKARQSVLPMTAKLAWASMQLYAHADDGEDTRPLVFRPYRGLLAFEPAAARFYLGRTAEVNEGLAKLEALRAAKRPRFLAVAGTSGTGKSSLVLAGILPSLVRAGETAAEENPAVAELQRSISALESTRKQLAGDAALEGTLDALRRKLSGLRATVGDSWQAELLRPGRDPLAQFAAALAQRRPEREFLLVVDQFEEIFHQTDDPEIRQKFARALWESCQGDSGIHCVVTIRTDFVNRCEGLILDENGLRLDRVLKDDAHRVLVAPLPPEKLRAAIVEPAARVGLDIEAGLADRLLADVGGEPGALPLLSDALDVLWQQRDGRRLTQAAYDAFGGEAGAVADGKRSGVVAALQRRADATIAKLRPEDRQIAQRLLISLVDVAEDASLDSRRPVPLDELRRSFGPGEGAGLDRVLRELGAARLLVWSGDETVPTVEVAHVALIRGWSQLRSWLHEERPSLVMMGRIRQDAKQWEQSGREVSLLYRGTQLAQARRSRELRLGKLEFDFLNASEERRDREAKYTQLAAGVLGVLLLLATGLGILAYLKSEEAEKEASDSHDGLLLSLAQFSADYPTEAATLLREMEYRTSPLWVQSAVSTLQAGVAGTVLRGHDAAILSVVYSRDGKKIVTGSRDRTVRVWAASGAGEPLTLRGHAGPVHAVAMSPNGNKIVTGSEDKTVRIWDVEGAGEPLVLTGHGGPVHAVAVSPDGKKFASGSEDGTVRVWSTEGAGEPLVLRGHAGPVHAVAWSADGSKLASGADDKTVRVWSLSRPGDSLVFEGHKASISAVAWSALGNKLASGSEDKTVRIFDVDGAGPPLVLEGLPSKILAVAVSPDGKRLAAGSYDGDVRIFWADGSGAPMVLKSHRAFVSSVAFSPDGKNLATGSGDKTVCVFDVDGSHHPRVLRAPELPLLSMTFSPDGKKVATGSAGHLVYIFHADGSGTPIVLRHRKKINEHKLI